MRWWLSEIHAFFIDTTTDFSFQHETVLYLELFFMYKDVLKINNDGLIINNILWIEIILTTLLLIFVTEVSAQSRGEFSLYEYFNHV